MAGQPLGLLFKRLLLGFSAMYFSIVALTNLVDLLDGLGALDWTFLACGSESTFRELIMLTVGSALVLVLIPDGESCAGLAEPWTGSCGFPPMNYQGYWA